LPLGFHLPLQQVFPDGIEPIDRQQQLDLKGDTATAGRGRGRSRGRGKGRGRGKRKESKAESEAEASRNKGKVKKKDQKDDRKGVEVKGEQVSKEPQEPSAKKTEKTQKKKKKKTSKKTKTKDLQAPEADADMGQQDSETMEDMQPDHSRPSSRSSKPASHNPPKRSAAKAKARPKSAAAKSKAAGPAAMSKNANRSNNLEGGDGNEAQPKKKPRRSPRAKSAARAPAHRPSFHNEEQINDIIAFAKKHEDLDPADTTNTRGIIKGDLYKAQHTTYNLYWSRAACGLRLTKEQRDFGHMMFHGDMRWTHCMTVAAKACEHLAS
jgi:hypothetical protein